MVAKKRCLKNWERIAKSRSANYLLLLSYNHSLKKNLSWSTTIKDIFSNVGQLELFLANDMRNKPLHVLFFERVCDIFHQEAFTEIHKDGSKLRTYAKLKTKIGLEDRRPYFTDKNPVIEPQIKYRGRPS